jgi:hypothetical protein
MSVEGLNCLSEPPQRGAAHMMGQGGLNRRTGCFRRMDSLLLRSGNPDRG